MSIIDKVVSGGYSKTTAARVMAASFPLSEEDSARILEEIEDPEDNPPPPAGGPPPPPPPPPPAGGPPPSPAPPPPGTPPEDDPEAERGDSRHLPSEEEVDRECREGESREECRARLARARSDQADHVHSDPVLSGTTGGIIDEMNGAHRHRRSNGELTGFGDTGVPHTHETDDGPTGPAEPLDEPV